jgi:hypothetical protein
MNSVVATSFTELLHTIVLLRVMQCCNRFFGRDLKVRILPPPPMNSRFPEKSSADRGMNGCVAAIQSGDLIGLE